MFGIWIRFLIIATAIGVAGYWLSHYADKIAEKTGIARNWIGTILLATVTSLPELVTGISATVFADAPDLAVGDLMGACVVNLALLGIVDFVRRQESIYSKAKPGHVLSAALNITLLATVLFGLAFAGSKSSPTIAHVGPTTPVLLILYLASMRFIYQYERREKLDITANEPPGRLAQIPLKSVILRYVVAALVVVGAGSQLPFVAEDIVHVMKWNNAFMGTLFLAIVTTLPETAVTISAIKMGSVDLAYSNILGSNLLNLALIGVMDFTYTPSPILAAASSVHIYSAASAILMIGIIISEATLAPSLRRGRWAKASSLGLISIFVFNCWLAFRYS